MTRSSVNATLLSNASERIGCCVGPPEQTKTLSVCFWESGDISRLNDDAVIGQYDLIVERDVTERDATGELALLGGECAWDFLWGTQK